MTDVIITVDGNKKEVDGKGEVIIAQFEGTSTLEIIED